MPQTRKKPSAVELYEQELTRRRPPGPRLSAVEIYEQGQRRSQPQPAPAPPTQQLGTAKNLALGAEQDIYGSSVPSALTGLEALGSAMTGDFGPARSIGEETLRSAGRLFLGGNPSFNVPARANEAAIQRIQAERLARRQGDPIYGAVERARQEVEQEAAQDPSLRGRIERGAGRFAAAAAPAVITGALTGGSVPAMTAVSAAQSLNAPENIPLAAGLGAIPVPAGKFVAPILRRLRAGRGAAVEAEAAGTALARQTVPAVTEAPPVVAKTPPAIGQPVPRPPAAPANPLQSAMQKLGTDDAEQIGEMIANANRRLNETITFPGKAKRDITKAERLSSWEDYGKLKQLTPDENRALSQVLPARTYSPVGIFEEGEGVTARAISDFPAGQPNAQLDANLRELEAFFTTEGKAPPMTTQIAGRMAGMARTPTSPVSLPAIRAEFPGLSKQQFDDEVLKLAEQGQVAIHRHDAPGLLSEADRNAMVKVGKDYYTAATVTGPRVGADLELKAAAGGAGQPPRPPFFSPEDPWGPRWERLPEEQRLYPSPPATPPAEITGKLFKRQLGQRELYTGRIATPAERTSLLQTISSLVKAGMLTRPTTHLKNLGSNAGFQISEELARVPGAIVDMLVSPFTRRRTFTGPNLASVGRSAYAAATRGVDDAIRALKTGRTSTEIEGLREIASGSKVLNAYVNGVFRLLKAEDAFFKAGALRRSLEDRARSLAITEARRGVITRGQIGQRTRELVKAPPADVASAAMLDAEVATFNNPNITGTIRKGISKRLERFGKTGQAVEFAIDRIMPFAKTPANVIARMLEYSGVTGGPKVVYRLSKAILKRSMSEAEQRAFAQTFGRASVGSALLGLGYIGYRDGWLTGLNEDETSKRARDTAAGRIPGAILVNGEWHQILGVSPLGNIVALGATLAREAEQEQTGDYLKQAGKASKVLGQAMLEQPLLSGTKEFIEGIQEPGTVGARVLGSTIGSAVPGAVSDVGQLIDYGVQRQAQTLPERVMQRIPGVRQTLPERQDVLGQPMEAAFSFNPARSQTAQQATNPLFAELVRHDIGISGFNKKPDETDEQFRQRKSDFGRLYIPYGAQLVSSPQYQRATPEIQQDAIKTLNKRAKELVEKGKQQYAKGPLSPAALIGAATGSQARERAKKNAGRK